MTSTQKTWTIRCRKLAVASNANGRAIARRSAFGSCRRAPLGVALVLLLSLGGVSVANSAGQMQSLDEQVQEVKADVLSIAAALTRLEEKLLYPSNTQVSVFVSITEGEELRLDSAQIQINGELVAHHLYSFKELEALQKGGVQRIYTGNVPTGEHLLEVSVAGKLPGGGDFTENESFSFSKDVEPKLVGVTLAGKDLGGVSIQPQGW